MPDEPKPRNEPAPILEGVIREAEGEAWHVAALAQAMAWTLRFWADPDRPPPPPFLLEHGYSPRPPRPGMTAEEAIEEARGVMKSLRHARAVLEGASSPETRDQRTLVRIVEAIEGEISSRALPEQLGAIVAAVLDNASFRFGVSESTWEALGKPGNRVLLGKAAGIKAGLLRPEPPRRGQPRPRRARWLEPLYLMALDARLTTAKDAASWGGSLAYLGILPGKGG